MEEYWRFNNGTSSHLTEWDDFKAVMRGALIYSIATFWAELRETGLALEKKRAAAESAFIAQPNSDTRDVLAEGQRKYTLHLKEYTQKRLLAQRLSIFADRDKNGKPLAFLAKTETPQTIVSAIQMPNGDLLSNPRDICNQFRTYYAQLYKAKNSRSTDEIFAFLDRFHQPLLAGEFITITIEEIQTAIGQMAAHKSPGPDGFPFEWYKLHGVSECPAFDSFPALF